MALLLRAGQILFGLVDIVVETCALLRLVGGVITVAVPNRVIGLCRGRETVLRYDRMRLGLIQELVEEGLGKKKPAGQLDDWGLVGLYKVNFVGLLLAVSQRR